jgi:hypothetical protein
VFILKVDKVICFHALLQVLILRDLCYIKIVQKWLFLSVPQFVEFASEGARGLPQNKKAAAEAAANYNSS